MQPESVFYYVAFWELHTCRLVDIGPIPWTAIDKFGERYCVDDEQAECLVDVIRRLDNWYVERTIAELKKDKPGKGKRKPKPKVTPKT